MDHTNEARLQKKAIFKNCIIELLGGTGPADHELRSKMFYGSNGRGVSIRNSIEQYEYDEYSNPSDTQCVLDTIVEIFDDYVVSLHAPAVYKQKIARILCEWVFEVAKKLALDDYQIEGRIIENYYVPDMAVEIIKSLHFNPEDPNKGITKRELCEKYKLKSKRTIETFFARLSGNDKQNPLRIAGQTVVTHVDSSGEEGKQRKYYTHDTISPIFLPANISQTRALLKGLYYSSRQNKDPFAMTLAVDIWSQLSDYAKDRIRRYYGSADKKFADFLKLVDTKSKSIFVYYKEESAYADDILEADNEYILGFVEKHGYRCSIWFVDETVDVAENAHIYYSSEDGAYVAETESGAVLFKPSDVWEIEIIK